MRKNFKPLTDEQLMMAGIPGCAAVLGTKTGDRVGKAILKFVESDCHWEDDWKEKLEGLTRDFEKLSAPNRVRAWAIAVSPGINHSRGCHAVLKAMQSLVCECFPGASKEEKKEEAKSDGA